MTDIVDFAKEKMKREVNGDCQRESPGGTLYRFDVPYFYAEGAIYGGGTFYVTIWARSFQDAEGHVKAMRATLGEPEQVLAEIEP